MSVICQNFVQNAWKKDLCSNCFKSVGDHESIDVVQNGENSTSGISEDVGGRYSPHPSNSYTTRNENTPHTTWKTLISERNNKNSQPFKLENGFQGRLLTINKALNGTDKQNKGETAKDKTKNQSINGITVKNTTTIDLKKQTTTKHGGLNQAMKPTVVNGSNLSNGQASHGKVGYNKNQKNGFTTSSNKQNTDIENDSGKKKASDKKQIQLKSTKSKNEDMTTHETPLHSILKKSPSTPVDKGCQARRSSNVGFKDEEPLVIGYGGRDFSPEELEWEMASSDGEAENGRDSLDETEDDKVFSKMTKQNTEFNSDNTNLLQLNKDNRSNRPETKTPPKKTENQNNKDGENKNKSQEINNEVEHHTNSTNQTSECPTLNSESPNKDVNDSNSDTDIDNRLQNEKHNRAIDKTEECDNANVKRTRENKNEMARAESKGTNDSVKNVATSGDKKSRIEKPNGVTVVKASEAVVTGVDVKNNSEFINGPASPSSSVDAPNRTESGKTVNAVMFSDGVETTWQENSSADGNAEWQDSDELSGQTLLQAINTSLTNRHKMHEDPGITANGKKEEYGQVNDNGPESEANKISVSVNNGITNPCDDTEANVENENEERTESIANVQPRESFLHGVATKPSAIYGPASDLFVSRSNSSSSSSSDEQGKGQISLSINVRINGEDSQCERIDSDAEENRSNSPEDECVKEKINYSSDKAKPEIPAKPVKQISDKYKQCDKSYSTKTTINEETLSFTVNRQEENVNEVSYYSPVPDRLKTSITLVDPYAESNIYQEVNENDLHVRIHDAEQTAKTPGRESKLAALAIELEQVRHTNIGTKRQAPAPPKVPDPPLEDPPSCAGRVSPVGEIPNSFSTFRGESMGFSSASSTTSTSSQDTEAGYASWNLHGDHEDHPKLTKSKSSFLLTQYSKCKMLAMGYAEDGAKARKRFSIKKLLKIDKKQEAPATFDPNCPNPKAWKYSDHFERPRAKLEIIHPMDLENKSVTVNPGFESLHSTSMSSFSPNIDDSFRNSVSSDYGSYYSDTLSPAQDLKQESNYEYIRPRQPIMEENEESCSKAGTSSSTSPTPSRSSTASQASTVTSGSSKNGAVPSHRPPKPPPPPRAHSLLPGNKVSRNPDGTFKFPNMNGDISSSDDAPATVTKPQAPKRQCKSVIIRSEYTNLEEQKITEDLQQNTSPNDVLENEKQSEGHEENNSKNTSSIQITQNENQLNFKEEENPQSTFNSSTKDSTSTVLQKSDDSEGIQVITSAEGIYDNLETSKDPKIQTSITIKTSDSYQKEKLSKSMLSRNKHPPLTKAPARPPPIYSKPQNGSFPKNTHPWRTLEDSYLALTSSNRELLIKLVNQALKKRKNYSSKLNKFQFRWLDFEIDASQPSSVFAFGEKIAYHATMPKYPEYSLTLVIAIQQQSHLQENSEIKYPLFGKFTDYIPSELLDSSGDSELESMPATILVLDRSNILTIEYFSESLPESLTEESEKELCFITLQLIQSLKSLQAQGIESIDTNCQNLLLTKTKHDKYHTLVFLYDICYEESDYTSDSCKISLCQYTLMLLFQMLRIQSIDDCTVTPKFSSNMSQKVFETAFSLLSEEKAVSLSQTKTLFECYLWGVTKVLESLQDSDDCDSILHRWLDIERSNCIKCIVNEESDINMQNEYYSQFLIRTNVRNIREVASYL